MGTKSQQKHPITINILQRMGSVLDLAIPSQAVLWCLFLVAFFSFLRKSNLTTPCAQTFDPTKHLTQKDIKFSSQGAVLRIHWSKTLQHREGMLLIPLPTIAGSPLCLVTAIQHYFQLVPADLPVSQKGATFILSPSPCFPALLKPSSRSSDWTPGIILLTVFVGAVPPMPISPGVPDHLIKLHGDWRSDANKLYLSLTLATRTQVADCTAAY